MRPVMTTSNGMLGAALVLALSGCGASPDDGSEDALARGLSDWATVDLATHQISYSAIRPDTDAEAYRTSQMLFRRLAVGDKELFVGVFEVTQQQWRLLSGGLSSPWTQVADSVCRHATAHGDGHPAYNVSFAQAMVAANGFTLAAGARLDLPSDVEWSAACGTERDWWWGSAADATTISDNAVVRESVITVDRLLAGGDMDTGGPLRVGMKAANAHGLYDIHGNVWEWTGDGAVRGGSWFDGIQNCRAEIRSGVSEQVDVSTDHALIGVRLVLRL